MVDIVEATAPGKIILFGEHSVVYNRPALSMAVDKRANVNVELVASSPKTEIVINAKDYGEIVTVPFSTDDDFVRKQPAFLHPVLHIIQKVFKDHSINESISMTISSKVPRGAGLGSSAAVNVAVSAALTTLFDLKYDLVHVSKLAYEGEKIVHGSPSGIDNRTSTFGGFLRFINKEGEPRQGKKLQLIVGNTNISRSTKVWVGKVRKRKNNFPMIMEKVFDSIGMIVDEADNLLSKSTGKTLTNDELVRLGELIDINHGLLSAIGVSIKRLEKLVYIARENGSYGAKLTGAGGGGCMFALVDDTSRNEVFEALRMAGANPIEVNLDFKGVTVVKK